MLLGLELELQIANKKGELVNGADQIISDERNKGNIIKELSKSMIEIIAPPASELSDLEKNFRKEVSTAIQIAEDNGLVLYPSTTVGPESNPISNINPRYASKRSILGDYKRNLEHHIAGTHVHVDKLENEKLFNQYLIMNAMDPIFTLMSSTPFFLGNNTLKDYRVELYRNKIFEDFPLQGQLLDYPKSLEEAHERQEITYNQWMDECIKKGFTGEGYNILNTCWGPLRFSKKTIESRASDSTLFSKVLALAATYKGICNYVDKINPEIEINKKNVRVGKLFIPSDEKITVPNYEQLKNLEYQGINLGLKNVDTCNYLQNIIDLAKQHLEPKEQHYLNPFMESLYNKKNLSDEIISFCELNNLEYNSKINEKSAEKVRLYIANKFLKDFYD